MMVAIVQHGGFAVAYVRNHKDTETQRHKGLRVSVSLWFLTYVTVFAKRVLERGSYFSSSFRNRPVCDFLQAATFSGVPVTTTSPPA
jgi:hypothetical protein